MINIYLARHGETIWNVEGRIQGLSDPGLSPKGYDQSLVLLERLKKRPISAIYTSTLQRSIHTALPMAECLCLPIQRQSELDEMAFGILEGIKISVVDGELKKEWERFKEDRFTYRIPGGENFTDVIHRIRPFVKKILEIHKGQEILIIGHRVVNQMLMGILLECPSDKILKIQQSNDCLYLITKNREVKVFHYINGDAGEGLLLSGQERNSS